MIKRMDKPDNWSSLMFFEKIKLYASTLTAEHAAYADKLVAKVLAKEQCPEIEIPRVVRVLDSCHDLRDGDIDPDCILKSAHASKWNNDFGANADRAEISRKLLAWNKKYSGPASEPHYGFIEPRFFIEEKIKDRILGKTGKAMVYMVRCLDGSPISIGVSNGTRQTNYDLGWNNLSNRNVSELKPAAPKPRDLSKIIDYAARLSAPFEFVRIDLYLSPEKICFSEYTFTPAGGGISFPGNVRLEKELGARWL